LVTMTDIESSERQDLPELDLDSIYGKLHGWVKARNLHLIEGTLTGASLECAFEADELTPESFCALAEKAGASLLYVSAPRFDAARDEEEQDEDGAGLLDRKGRARLAALEARAVAEHGRRYELCLRFVVHGLVHTWETEAGWYGELQSDFEELEEDYAPKPPAKPEDPPSTPEEVDRIATLLVDLPAFREATKNTERERILLGHHPALKSCRHNGLSQLGYEALREATYRATDAAKKAYADFAVHVPELVTDILAAGILNTANTAPARKAAIRTYLMERSGGYPPPRDFVDQVHGEPLLKKPRQVPSSSQDLSLWGSQ
jgi:hypothetical protein